MSAFPLKYRYLGPYGVGCCPWTAQRGVQIEASDLLEVLKRIEAKGVIDTAHRTREVCGRIFYAIATGRAKHDIAAELVGAIAPRTTTHYASITDPSKLRALLRAFGAYDAAALRLAPYVFVRPGELRAAE